MDRTELAPLIRDRLGLPSDDNRVNNTTIYNSINAALRRMANDFSWPWLMTTESFTLTSGTSTHAVPADFQRTLWISIPADNIELRNSQRRSLIRWSSVHSYPRLFSTEGRVLTFAPTPRRDHDIIHAYVHNERQLTDDVLEPYCPDSDIDVIVLYAAIYQATKLKDTTLLSTLKSELQDLKASVEMNTAARPLLSIRARHSWRLW